MNHRRLCPRRAQHNRKLGKTSTLTTNERTSASTVLRRGQGQLIFLILGIQATGTLMTVFSWLLPVSLILLTGTLLYISGKIQIS